ncbi:MAG: PilN domain-containing protein [Planctomycetota bacterium]
MSSHLNLLPEEALRRQLIRRQARRWILIYLVFFLMAGGILTHSFTESRRSGTELEAAQRRFTPVNEMIQESEFFTGEIETLQRRESLALELSRNRSFLTLLGTLSNAAAECEDNVNVQSLVFQPNQNTSGQSAASKYELTLQGIGIDNLTVARFELELRNSGLFNNVELTSTGATKVGDHDAFMYTLVCHF